MTGRRRGSGKKGAGSKKTRKKKSVARRRKSSRKKGGRKKSARKKSPLARFRRVAAYVVLAGAVALGAWLWLLDREIRTAFEGRRWQVPARVYAQPLELYAGRALTHAQLTQHLDALGYRKVAADPQVGQYSASSRAVEFARRGFVFWDGVQPVQQALVTFRGSVVSSVRDRGGAQIPILRLDPVLIGSIVPGSGEDRVVLAPAALPPLLPAALVAIEDRDFYRHHGLDFSAIARAAWVNLRAGAVRQGGSTLTQQLVKNYFLNNERTFRRKLREAFMALLLDARYTKEDLLAGYVNEVFLGQDGPRAVHGFGLASQFYFGRPLGELDLHHTALLVAMVRGPSLYDPRRNPDKASARRNRVLETLAARGVVSEAAAAAAMAKPLDVVSTGRRVSGRFPAFMSAVRQQLDRDYRREDLTDAGLTVFTTLDHEVQLRAEQVVAAELAGVERRAGITDKALEAAVVVTDPASGELLAVIGGRQAGYAGFNRAVEARRPIGSLIKPFVYLAALEEGSYHLASQVRDAPLDIVLDNGDIWSPQNISREHVGDLPLYRALAESINLPAVHVGMDIGPGRVARTLVRVGIQDDPPTYPSLLLGAIDLAPLDVARAYGTLANGGYLTPLKAVRAVIDEQGRLVNRYPLVVEPVADARAVAQINAALVEVMLRGTGRAASARLPATLTVAGKTGTSNDLRDGWFAGFSGDRLVVVWVGRDDNATLGMTGSQSALPLWAALMRDLAHESLLPVHDDRLALVEVDYPSGARAAAGCGDTVLLPLPASAQLPVLAGCDLADAGDESVSRFRRWLRERFGD